MKKTVKRFTSVLLVAVMLVTVCAAGFGASAATHKIEIFNGSTQVTERVAMEESTSIKFNVQLIDCSMPDGGYIRWYSATPLIASVDQEGLVRAHDSSKGAALRLWIDNEVRPIPVLGNTLAGTLEGVFNTLDVDAMDTEQIVDTVQDYLGLLSQSVAQKITDSLRGYLNSLDVGITATLYSKDGAVLATDEIRILVNKSTAISSDFIPNGTFITNKETIPTTVEVGASFKLEGAVTPLRLKMGVSWNLEVDNILEKGTDYASVDANGKITFLKAGKVTVKASPNVDGFMANLKKYIEYMSRVSGSVDTDKLADLLINVVGINVNKTVLSYALKALIKLNDSGTLEWGSDAVTSIANYLLKLKTNDTITFTILDNIQIESFGIDGETTVTEGDKKQLQIVNVVPAGANVNSVTWAISDRSVAVVNETGVFTGRDAGGATSYNKRTATVTATIDGVTASKDITVTGKLITSPTDVEISGPALVSIGATAQYSYEVYPLRSSKNAVWGLIRDDGTVATASSGSVSNSYASINSSGLLTGIAGGIVTVVAKISDSVIGYYKVRIGIAATGVTIDQGDAVQVKVPTYQLYTQGKAQLTATVYPSNASNKNIIWSVNDSEKASVDNGLVKNKKLTATYVVVTATTEDGSFTSSCMVSFANFPVTGVSLNKSALNITIGSTASLSATVSPVLSWTTSPASIEDVMWVSSNNSIVTVDGGKVTPVSVGEAVVKVITCDGLKTASCAVSVVADKSALNEVINLVEQANINPDDYLPSDIAALNSALADAKTVRDERFAPQENVDRAEWNLVNAYDALNIYIKLQGAQILYGGSAAPSHISVEVGALAIYTNQSIDLNYTITPADAMCSAIYWTSNDDSLSVDSNGVCKPSKNAAAKGLVTLTATDYLGNVSHSSVYVTFVKTKVTGVSLNTNSIPDALIGNTATLTATVEPKGTLGVGAASIGDVSWSSSDSGIVSVNGGKLTYLAKGTATVTATTVDGGFKASCTITVSINKTALQLAIDSVNNANLVAEDYTDDTWAALQTALTTANAVLADPDAEQEEINAAASALNAARSGLKRYIKVNAVYITQDGNDVGEFVAKEVNLITSLSYKNNSVQLDSRLSPLDGMYKSVEWKSSSSSISVDQSGKCTPTENKACYSTITVKVTDSRGHSVTDSTIVSFAQYPAHKVNVSPSSLRVNKNDAGTKLSVESKYVTSLVTLDATIQDVIWSSSNEAVATVDSSGKLTYRDSGVATIYATSVNGGVQGSCSLVVGGDKSALIQAIAETEARNINVQDWTYETSTAYTNAYNHAVAVRDGDIYSQAEIDKAKNDLLASVDALVPYIHMTSITATYEGADAPNSISIKVEYYQTYTSKSVQLGYYFAPQNAMYSSIVWSSSDGSLSVDQSGLCKPSANKAAAAIVSVTATDHYGNKISDSVYVSFANRQVTGVSISNSSLTVDYGAAAYQLSATVQPNGTLNGASKSDVSWTSSNNAVATVSEEGLVTFVEAGTATITVTTIDGGFTATCLVTVRSDKTALREALAMIHGLGLSEIDYTTESWSVFAQKLARAEEVYAIDNPPQMDINSSAEELLAAYRALVRVYPLRSVTITRDGAAAPDFISIEVPVTSTYQSKNVTLGYNLNPTNATVANVSWTSSKSSVKFENGVCTPAENKACYSLITVTVTDYLGNVATDSVWVSFANTPATGVSLNNSSLSGINGQSGSLSATVAPEGTWGVGAATIKDVLWYTSNAVVVSVDGGTLRYNGVGKATITVRTADGGHSASCEVTVTADKSSLLAAINSVNALKQNEYTRESWNSMSDYLPTANTIYNDAAASQESVNAAAAELNARVSALVRYIYVSSAAIYYNGANASGNVTVIVPADGEYIVSSAVLTAVSNPANAMYKSVEWSATGNVSVSADGVVTPKVNSACYGNVTLTLIDDFGNRYTASTFIAFTKTPVTGVSLDRSDWTGAYTEPSVQLNATVFGKDNVPSDLDEIRWTSSDPSIVSVDENGLVDIVSGGIATVTVTTVIGGYRASCVFNVTTDKAALLAKINEIESAGYVNSNYTNDSYQNLVTKLAEAKAVYNDAASSQSAINSATANLEAAKNALVTYVVPTSVGITYNGSAAPSHISVQVPVYNSYTSKSVSLGCTINPSGAMYTSVTWSASGNNIEVNQSGVVKPSANKASYGLITCTVKDYYGRSVSASVYVAFANTVVTGVSLDKSSNNLAVGASFTLTPTVAPEGTWGVGGATVKDVVWKSSAPDRISVDSNGKVTAIDGGTAVITCTTVDGGHSASCTVTVSVDKTSLYDEISSARSFSSLMYTPGSYAVLTQAISAAQAVYDDPTATLTAVNKAIGDLQAAQNNLVYITANYTALNAAVAKAEAVDGSLYTEISYNALMNIVNNVDYTKSIVEQEYVNNTKDAILAAIAALVYRPANYSELNGVVSEANNINAQNYVTETYTHLRQIINGIDYTKNITQQQYVDEKTEEVRAAMQALRFKPADYSGVDAALWQVSGVNRNLYTAETLAALDAAVSAVDRTKIITEQSAVDAMCTDILAAIDALEYKPADYTGVLAAVAQATEKDEALYTSASYGAMMSRVNAVDYTRKINDQLAVDRMRDNILAAINALQYKPADFTELDIALEAAGMIDGELYTEASYLNLLEALMAVDYDKNITEQADVDAMTMRINDAINALVPIGGGVVVGAADGSTTVIDRTDKTITGLELGLSNLDNFLNVQNGSYRLKQGSTTYGTGAKVEILDRNGNVIDEMTIIIYGDINGDGRIDSIDVSTASRLASSMQDADGSGRLAADINGDGKVDSLDLSAISRASSNLGTISQVR